MMPMPNLRQRFFVEHCPIRGDVVRLSHSYAQVISNKDYPVALQKLLGEMLVASSLLIGTLKIEGYLSIQLQNSQTKFDNQPCLKWAMAECDDKGNVRGLADWSGDWTNLQTANEAFAQLGQKNDGVLFIHIQPKNESANAEGYQGIVERVADNLADCLTHYQQQSVQIPTVIKLACDGLQAGGMLLQLLPNHDDDLLLDDDLFPRLKVLTQTLSAKELTQLSADEILYRLFHEEKIIVPEPTALQFACTCSLPKSESAILQLGKQSAFAMIEAEKQIVLDCGFCGKYYHFDQKDIENLFS